MMQKDSEVPFGQVSSSSESSFGKMFPPVAQSSAFSGARNPTLPNTHQNGAILANGLNLKRTVLIENFSTKV